MTATTRRAKRRWAALAGGRVVLALAGGGLVAGAGCRETKTPVVVTAQPGGGAADGGAASDPDGALLADDVEASEGAVRLTLPATLAPRAFEEATLVVEAAYGAGAGQLGGAGASEGEDEPLEGGPPVLAGPQALALSRAGRLFVLDAVNTRLVSWALPSTDAPADPDAPPPAPAELPLAAPLERGDLALDADGRAYVLGVAPEARLSVYASGVLQRSTALALDDDDDLDPLGLTVAPDGRVFVSMSDGSVRLERDAAGGAEAPGVPLGAGLYAAASVHDDGRAAVQLVDEDDTLVAELVFESAVPLERISQVAGDEDGRVYVVFERVAAEPARLGEAPDAEHLVAVVSADGTGLVVLALPVSPIHTPLRPLAFGADGAVYQLVPGAQGVKVVRWSLGVLP